MPRTTEFSSKPNPKAGRPIAFDRNIALEGAINLFWNQGVSAVTTLSLAKAMGIQRSSFYNSFSSKEVVFKEALLLYHQKSPDRWLQVIKPGDAVLPQLKGYFKELCRVRAEDTLGRGCLFCNCVAELAGKPSELGKIIDNDVEQRIAWLETIFEQAESQGEIPKGSYCDDMGSGFMAFIFGLNTLSKVLRSEARLWETCELYFENIQHSFVAS